jgi:hypothetical protein
MSTMNILGGLTAFMGGLATQAQSREVARNIEFLAGVNSANFLAESANQAKLMERQAESSVASINSQYAASGVDITSGSAFRVAASEASAAAGTITNFKRNSEIQARLIKYQGATDAYNVRAQGAQAAINGTASLLGSFGNIL